jgi:hypothetical protein
MTQNTLNLAKGSKLDIGPDLVDSHCKNMGNEID